MAAGPTAAGCLPGLATHTVCWCGTWVFHHPGEVAFFHHLLAENKKLWAIVMGLMGVKEAEDASDVYAVVAKANEATPTDAISLHVGMGAQAQHQSTADQGLGANGNGRTAIPGEGDPMQGMKRAVASGDADPDLANSKAAVGEQVVITLNPGTSACESVLTKPEAEEQGKRQPYEENCEAEERNRYAQEKKRYENVMWKLFAVKQAEGYLNNEAKKVARALEEAVDAGYKSSEDEDCNEQNGNNENSVTEQGEPPTNRSSGSCISSAYWKGVVSYS